MEFLKKTTHIDFIKHRFIALIVSAVLVVAGIASLIVKGGPNYGIDFAGGMMIQLKFQKPTPIKDIRQALKKIDLGDSVIQRFGDIEDNEVLIRVEKKVADLENLGGLVEREMEKVFSKGSFEVRRVEMVGPKVGKDLRNKGIMAILWAMLGILIYITWRFELKLAVGAIVAVFHDIFITIGIFSLTNREIDLTIVAGLLTIAGYSINDTIVTFDRFRENLKLVRKFSYRELLNKSINETLNRTMLTSLTTLLVTVVLLVLGGDVIRGFAFALTVGVLVGTYSSIFIASPIVDFWYNIGGKRKKRPQHKKFTEWLRRLFSPKAPSFQSPPKIEPINTPNVETVKEPPESLPKSSLNVSVPPQKAKKPKKKKKKKK
jgi:preprotein translocase subunit SecF